MKLPQTIKERKPLTPQKSKSIRFIARNIKYFRHKQGISQEYLAELSNLHRNYVGQVERREVNISIISLEEIAKALKIDVIELLQQRSDISYSL